jgi:hypothetical protein
MGCTLHPIAPPIGPLGPAKADGAESAQHTRGKCMPSTKHLGRKLLVFNSFRPNFP